MPTVDLAAVLEPVVQAVRDTYFPDVVTIQSRTTTPDGKGQPVPSFATLEADVPAVITHALRNDDLERPGQVLVTVDHVRILMEGEHTVPDDGRIVRTGGGTWDVEGVRYDPVRVTTSVLARVARPGAP